MVDRHRSNLAMLAIFSHKTLQIFIIFEDKSFIALTLSYVSLMLLQLELECFLSNHNYRLKLTTNIRELGT
jgi:hypothetical protein